MDRMELSRTRQASFDKGMKDGSRVVLAGEAEGLGKYVTEADKARQD